jgi:hypothetical protein
MLAMNWLFIGIALIAVGATAVLVLRFVRRPAPADNPANWPVTEATIQIVGRAIGSARGSLPIDVGDFSYVVNDEYYSGRATISRSFSAHETQPKDLVNKKFQLRYDPRKPEKFDLAESDLEGYIFYPYDDFLMQDIDDN